MCVWGYKVQSVNVWLEPSEVPVSLPLSRNSVTQISWSSDCQVNVLVLCKPIHLQNKNLARLFYMRDLSLYLMTVCVSALDRTVTPLFRCASYSPGDAGGWEAVGTSCVGGEKCHIMNPISDCCISVVKCFLEVLGLRRADSRPACWCDETSLDAFTEKKQGAHSDMMSTYIVVIRWKTVHS